MTLAVCRKRVSHVPQAFTRWRWMRRYVHEGWPIARTFNHIIRRSGYRQQIVAQLVRPSPLWRMLRA